MSSICNKCGLPVVPWVPHLDNQLEQVAISLGTLCMLCFQKAQEEFAEMKMYAIGLRESGHTSSEIDKLMVAKYDIEEP